MHINGERYNFEHIIHLIREIDHLKTEIQPHDTGHIHTTISTLERRVNELMVEHHSKEAEIRVDSFPEWRTEADGSITLTLGGADGP